MPGSSLWLVPPDTSELYAAIHALILDGVPAVFPTAHAPPFYPHVTLTSDIVVPDLSRPQEWLDALPLPTTTTTNAEDDALLLRVRLQALDVGPVFFRKLTIACDKSPELAALAAACRRAATTAAQTPDVDVWVRDQYRPHCSLMYSEMAFAQVAAKLESVGEAVRTAKLQHSGGSSAGTTTTTGGEVWLVPTFRPIGDWKPVAVRRLPKMQWTWET